MLPSDAADPGGSFEMMEVAVLCYGMVASFVMASFSRNKREQQPNPAILNLFGWLLLSFSAAIAVMLIGWAGLSSSGLTTI